MAATDITGVIMPTVAPFSFEALTVEMVNDIDVLDPSFAGIQTVATHNILEVPEGKALTDIKVVILDTFTSAGAATVKFTAGGKDVTAAIAIAKLTKGTVLSIPMDIVGDCKVYAHDVASLPTIDMTVGTADLTAGRLLMYTSYRDVKGILENG